jgi:hypothetical protein
MSQRQAAEKLTPEQFFDDIVPRIMGATVSQRAQLQGTCEVHLFGEQSRAWTIDLKAGTVQPGTGTAYDVCLEMEREDFHAMMQNRLDVQRAILDGRVRYAGNLPVLRHFAFLLQPRSMEY